MKKVFIIALSILILSIQGYPIQGKENMDTNPIITGEDKPMTANVDSITTINELAQAPDSVPVQPSAEQPTPAIPEQPPTDTPAEVPPVVEEKVEENKTLETVNFPDQGIKADIMNY